MKTLLQSTGTKIVLAALLLSFVAVKQSAAQIPAGTYTISTAAASLTNYQTVGSAIADLNGVATRPDGGPIHAGTGTSGTGTVTFNISAGSETLGASAGGYVLNYGGNASCPVVFTTNGATYTINSDASSGSGTKLEAGAVSLPVGTATINGDAFITLNGVSYVTFDGVSLAELYPGNYTYYKQDMEMGYLFTRPSATQACQYVSITNSTINFYSNTLNPNTFGIVSENMTAAGGAGGTVTTTAGQCINNTISGCTISNTGVGIFISGYGSLTVFTNWDHNWTINNNTVTNFGGSGNSVVSFQNVGIIYNNQTGISVANNSINNAIDRGSNAVWGIYMGYGNDNSINNNKIYNLLYTGTNTSAGGVLGITCGSWRAFGGSQYIYNNLIADLRMPANTYTTTINPIITGINLTSSTLYNGIFNVFYNTIYLNAAPNNPSTQPFETVGLNLGYNAASVTKNIENNIVVNTSTPGSNSTFTAALYRQSISGTNAFSDFTTLNNNNYYVPTGANYYIANVPGATGSPWATFSAYQTSATAVNASFENNSKNIDMTQSGYWANSSIDASTNYLQLGGSAPTTITQGGTPVTSAEGVNAPSGISTDWAGTTRSGTTPSIGAFEYVSLASNAITTGTITGSPFCAGLAVSVPFTNVGVGFTSGNTFTAELSSATGTFPGTIIGTSSSTANSGTISATLPFAATTASLYRIRVYSSTPAATTINDNGANLSINAGPTFSPSSFTEICTSASTASLYFSTTGTPNQYSIAYNSGSHTLGFTDVSTTGIGTSPLVLSVPSLSPYVGTSFGGNITVTNSTTTCSSAPTPFTFTVDAQISFTIGTNPAVCYSASSQPVTLPYTINSGGLTNYYQVTWEPAAVTAGFSNTGLVTSPPANPLGITVPAGAPAAVYNGTYQIRSSATACPSLVPSSTTSYNFTVTVGDPSAPSPTATTPICEGSAPTVAAVTALVGATSYNWSISGTGNSISGTGTSATITWGTTYTGTAHISVTATGVCGTSAAGTFDVTVNTTTPAAPTTPTGATTSRCIGAGTDTYNSTGATGYVWNISPSAAGTISGTGSTGTVTWNSTYTGVANISAINNNGCANSVSSAALPVYVNIMNGAYTIDKSVSGAANLYPVTTTFNSFASAVSALACGVSGPVTFNVAAGTYSEQVILPATEGNIPGASATNTITFNGGTSNAATRIITSAGTGGNYATVTLNGCQYVTFKNLTIANTNITNGWGVLFYASLHLNTNNQLQNCTVNVSTTNSGANTNLFGIAMSGSYTATNTGATNPVSNCTIDGCTLNYGSSNLIMWGFGGLSTGNVISNNTFLNSWTAGILVSGTPTGFKIRNNTITGSLNPTFSDPGGYGGIRINNNTAATTLTDYVEISGNICYQFTTLGLSLQSDASISSPTYPLRVFNNLIGGGIPTAGTFILSCVYITAGTANVNFWNNTFLLNAVPTTGTQPALYIGSNANPGNYDVRNNIIAYTGASAVNGQPFSISAAAANGSTIDYNLFYNAAGTNQANISGTQYTTANVIGGGGFNANSHIANPFFVSTNVTSPDLHITDQCTVNRGIAIPSVATDIDNQARLDPPNVGADEIPLTAGPTIIVTPNNAVCTGGTSATLVASGGVSYTWSPTSNLTPSNGTSATETAQISLLTIYTVTGTGTNGCTANTVVPVATVAVGGTISPIYSIICSGGTKPLTVSGAAGNYYQWQISSNNATWSDISGATNTTYTTNTTDGNTNKYYRLQAQSNSCWNVASTTAEVDVSQPTINVTTSALTDNSVTLNWTPIGSGNYTINYTGASTGTVLGTTPPKTLNGLTANGNYTITLNQTGAGLGTCPASGTATVTTLCPAPTAVTIISTGTNSITLTWTGGAGNYRVYYRPLYVNNGYFTKDVIGGTSTSLTKQGTNSLYHSLTYEIYVTKLDCPALGNVGQPSAKVYATTTPALACAAPVIDSVKSACPVQLEVFMHGSPTNQYFIDVERLTPTIQPVQSFPVTGSYFTANVSAGQNYLITARSICGGAVSNLTLWPGALQVKPQCGTLNNLLLSNPTCNGFTASWNADQCLANNASYYELYIRQVGTLNWNGYGVIIPTYPVGPYKLVNWLPRGKSYDVYAKAVYSCNGYLTYGATTQTTRITTLSAGCREEASNEEQLKPISQQTSADNSEVFTLYPNPNSGKFTVDLSRLNTNEDAVRIEVLNMLGQTVITQLTSISDGHLTEFINMPASATAGTYIVRVTAGKNVYTSKMNISK